MVLPLAILFFPTVATGQLALWPGLIIIWGLHRVVNRQKDAQTSMRDSGAAFSDYDRGALLNSEMPHTFNALQQLVMRMANYVKQRDILASGRGENEAKNEWTQFEDAFRETIVSMYLDEIVAKDASSRDVSDAMYSCILSFAEAFPNWQDAYRFSEEIFLHSPEKAISIVEEIRR
jgi:hypothetical protein